MLDTRVFRSTYLESDHELCVSTVKFKIKAKRHFCKPSSRHQTHSLSDSSLSAFRSTLSAALSRSQGTGIEETWCSFRDAMKEAHHMLPEVPQRHEADLVTDELRNLAKKKRSAWLRLRDDSSSESLRRDYKRLRKATKVAAEKARNSWWSRQAAEAEQRAWAAEQAGHGGSLIKELRLLRARASKPTSSSLLDRDGHMLCSDDDKLQRAGSSTLTKS